MFKCGGVVSVHRPSSTVHRPPQWSAPPDAAIMRPKQAQTTTFPGRNPPLRPESKPKTQGELQRWPIT
jgi:hypothetical protein